MKKPLLMLALLPCFGTAQAAEQFDNTSCHQLKEAVELFLGFADANFKEAEALRKRGDQASAKDKFEEAISMSELAENYSSVYTAFCKP